MSCHACRIPRGRDGVFALEDAANHALLGLPRCCTHRRHLAQKKAGGGRQPLAMLVARHDAQPRASTQRQQQQHPRRNRGVHHRDAALQPSADEAAPARATTAIAKARQLPARQHPWATATYGRCAVEGRAGSGSRGGWPNALRARGWSQQKPTMPYRRRPHAARPPSPGPRSTQEQRLPLRHTQSTLAIQPKFPRHAPRRTYHSHGPRGRRALPTVSAAAHVPNRTRVRRTPRRRRRPSAAGTYSHNCGGTTPQRVRSLRREGGCCHAPPLSQRRRCPEG
jgi:hypothetical protein